jgi:Protein of unknown function (DUF3014)
MKFKIFGALVLVLGSAAAWHWWPHLAPAPAPPPPVVAPLQPDPEATAAIAHPIAAAASGDTATPALPSLTDSDTPFSAVVRKLTGDVHSGGQLVTENLIRHLVATVDNLPRRRLSVELRPLRATPGPLLATGDDLHATLDERNAARYELPTALLSRLDMAALAQLYKSYYPLFQRAYQDLGYPHGYFNDRLVAVIDHLLATPEPNGALELVRPKVFWEYADPELEARSAGQKFMLRVGSANAALLRGKLRELRAQIAAAEPAATATR